MIQFDGLPIYWMLGPIAIVILFFVLTCVLFHWLWNSTLPELFNFPRIRFWQAIKLMMLVTLVFGGVGDFYSKTTTSSDSVTTDMGSESNSTTYTISFP